MGGSNNPEPNSKIECVLFAVDGTMTLTIEDAEHVLKPGGLCIIFLQQQSGPLQMIQSKRRDFIGFAKFGNLLEILSLLI